MSARFSDLKVDHSIQLNVHKVSDRKVDIRELSILLMQEPTEKQPHQKGNVWAQKKTRIAKLEALSQISTLGLQKC